MNKTLTIILVIFALALIACSGAIIYQQCFLDSNNIPPEEDGYLIEVHTEGGLPLQNVGVKIYSDENKTKLLSVGKTDKGGCANFDIQPSDGMIAVLDGVEEGYALEDFYKADSHKNMIVLKISLPQPDLNRRLTLGSVTGDFTFTDANGNTHRVSDILKEKKALVLNFWFLNCGPCRMEFPYMQQAYEDFKDDIEIIAVNPVDGTDSSIRQFADELKLTFPMAVGEIEWQNALNLQGYPTTVVIDRYGTVCMMHTGSITDKETFVSMFEFFTEDNYKTSILRNLKDLEKQP